jgi:hypothetical protein
MTALATMLQVVGGHHIGFFGVNGILGLLLGLVFLIVVCALLFKIFMLLLPKLGVSADWVNILYWVFVLIIFIAVFTAVFGYWS